MQTLLVSMQDGSDPDRVKASLTQLLRERRSVFNQVTELTNRIKQAASAH